MKNEQTYWWIAINGASAAMSSGPLPRTVKCLPTPQQLIGFTDYDIAVEFQRMTLTAPVKELQRRFDAMQRRHHLVPELDVVIIEPDNPEPPTRGVTIWLDQEAWPKENVRSMRSWQRAAEFLADPESQK